MNEEIIGTLLPITVAIIAAIPGVFAYANERRRIRREADDTALTAWQSLLNPLREQVATLTALTDEQSATITSMRKRLEAVEDMNAVLERQLDGAQRLVTAYLAQLMDAKIAPNPVYIEQTRSNPE